MDNQQLHSKGLAEGQTLRSYQLDGVTWLKECYDRGEGGLLCDEMGLGKTCQAICFLVSVSLSQRPMSLVLCPLTVLDNWKQEFTRFTPKVKVVTYIGDQDMRSRIRKAVRKSAPDVLLTTYDMCLRDNFFFEKRVYNAVVVDEGHRLKNSESLLYKSMEGYNALSRVLLTGTPVQNVLGEMFSLLSFVAPATFELANKEDFIHTYKDVKTDERVSSKLQSVIKPYVLRRTKGEVALDIPGKSEVLVYHPISDLQKKYYKAILTKDADAFETENSVSKTKLLNILMQLRKCVNHPYLFDGVEPEPFQLGEHLVEASAKLVTLDKILHHLAMHNHKVLIFSQMTRVLDILQDYLHYRDYTYERLDGSVRGEERFTAVRNFNSSSETFVFLLSSRAGGQGLNLTAADTVIFYDHDFNPQVDLQAAARAHRIGQTRPVKIIRLVAKATVEEVILSRAEAKLKLTQSVMSKPDDKDADDDLSSCVTKDLQKMLKFGLTSLLSPDNEEDELNIEEILGATENSKWVIDKVSADAGEEELTSSQQPNTIYQFEGKDYSKEQVAPADDEAFQKLMADARVDSSEEGTSRRKRTPAALSSLSLPDVRTRKPLTAEQLEARRKQREATLQKRKEEAEAREKKKQAKMMERWRVAGYTSHSLPLPSDDEETEASDGGSDVEYMHFVSGDVTQPVKSKAIVIQCVDDSGEWGSGGVFTALSNQTKQPELYYELAGDMGDLKEGDAHMVSCDDILGYEEYKVALLLAQDRKLRVKQSLLATCLQKISHVCRRLRDVSVHLPRIGYNTSGFDWYSTERQLRKYLSNRKVHTYIYYYKRQSKRARSPSPPAGKRSRNDSSSHSTPPGVSYQSDEEQSANQPSTSTFEAGDSPPHHAGVLLDLFTNINFYIDTSIDGAERKKLKRYIIAFDGNVEACETERTNFIVTAGGCDTPADSASVHVKPDFVFDCIADQRPLKL